MLSKQKRSHALSVGKLYHTENEKPYRNAMGLFLLLDNLAKQKELETITFQGEDGLEERFIIENTRKVLSP